MREYHSRPSRPTRPEKTPYVTSAIGLEETQGRLRARRSTLFTRTLIWVTGLICLAFLLGSLAQAWTNSQLMQRLQQQTLQTQQTQASNAQLQQQARYYANPWVIEREAREKFNYVRPGEHLIVVVGADQSRPQQQPGAKSSPSPQNFWQQWWDTFFGD